MELILLFSVRYIPFSSNETFSNMMCLTTLSKYFIAAFEDITLSNPCDTYFDILLFQIVH